MFVDLIGPTRRRVDDTLAAAPSKTALARNASPASSRMSSTPSSWIYCAPHRHRARRFRPEAIDAGSGVPGPQGFDSLTAVELRNRLKVATGLSACHPTPIFDYPNPAELARCIRGQVVDEADAGG